MQFLPTKTFGFKNNGEAFFGRPSGRVSNGRLVIDFLAESLGKPFLHSYLDSLAANFSHGTSFSASGATITQPKYLIPVYFVPRGWSPFFLYIQFLQFTQFKDRSEIIYNEDPNFKYKMPKKEHFSKALYTIDIGQNDIGMGLFTNKSIEAVKASVPNMIQGLKAYIKGIYSLGAKTFWIHNTGPIGCLPYILTNFPISNKDTDSAGCSIPHNEISKHYNYKLNEANYHLQKELPSAAITLVDIYSVKCSIYKETKSLGTMNWLARAIWSMLLEVQLKILLEWLSGCFKLLAQLVLLDALEKTSLVRRCRRTQHFLELMFTTMRMKLHQLVLVPFVVLVERDVPRVASPIAISANSIILFP